MKKFEVKKSMIVTAVINEWYEIEAETEEEACELVKKNNVKLDPVTEYEEYIDIHEIDYEAIVMADCG